MRTELEAKALCQLKTSLEPLPHEKNELDWKLDLSAKTNRLAEHFSVFANYPGGGFLVFGVSNNGMPTGIRELNYNEIIQRLGNIARDGVCPSIAIDHSIPTYQDKEILFIHIPESLDKPVHIRGKTALDSYVRSAGQTRKMTNREIGRLMALSGRGSFEAESASQA